MLRAYKTKLDLTEGQKDFFRGCAGAARYVFNWALADRKTAWEERQETVNKFEQKRRFNGIKDELCPWIREYPYTLLESAFDHVDLAYRNFFRRIRNHETPGYPKFKSRYGRQHFTLRGNIHVESSRIKLPKSGWVRLAEKDYLPTDSNVKILSANLSFHAGNWYVSLQVDTGVDPSPLSEGPTLGIDLGYGVLATVSDGTVYENPEVYRKHESRLAKLQKKLSRQKRGGSNYGKTKAKLAKLHDKIADTRAHHLHNASKDIARKGARVIAMENLSIKEMMEDDSTNSKYAQRAKRFADASVSELRRQITYKQEWGGGEVVLAERTEPTNKRCHHCRHVQIQRIDPRQDTWRCENCGTEVDRRLNTAENLVQLARRPQP